MDHERQFHGNVQVLFIKERELGFDVSQRFKRLLREYIAASAGPMVVCLEKVEFVDSTALSALLAAQRWLQQAGHPFCICSISGPVLRIIRLTSLDKHLNIQPDITKALASMHPPERASGDSPER